MISSNGLQRKHTKTSSANCSFLYGGEGGIRTHGTVSRTLVFKTSSFNHSDTSPDLLIIQDFEEFSPLRLREAAACALPRRARCIPRYSHRKR